MRSLIYGVWSLVPLFFLLNWLWGVLERTGKEQKRGSSIDSFKQFLFVLACVGVAVLIDQLFLEDLVNSLIPDLFPLAFYQVLLLPLVLYLGALVLGPSRHIRIEKAPNPSRPKRRS